MRSAYVFLLAFLSYTLALTQDQIFQNDWQTVNIGVPFASVHTDQRIFTLSELGIFSIINATTGGILYRYQSEISPIRPTSGLVEVSNKQIISFINYEEDSSRNIKSKLFLWGLLKSYGVIEKELDFTSNIVAVLLKDDHIYVVDERHILDIDIKSDYEITTLYKSEHPIVDARIFYSALDKSIYAAFEIGSKVFFSTLSNFVPIHFDGCRIKRMRFHNSLENLMICNDSDVYAFDSFGYRKLKSGRNMINEKLSAESLSADPIKGFEVVKDHILIESENEITLFNHEYLSLSADAKSFLSYPLSDSIHHSFHVSKNSTEINLLVVSPNNVVDYYRNGELLWSNDQSFVDIKDFVVVGSELKSSLTVDELIFEKSSNILLSYFRRIRHNYQSLFGKLDSTLDEAHRFGMSKYLIALSENGKIGVFSMYKNENNTPQLEKIFTPQIQFTHLYKIDRKIYALHDASIYEVDIKLGQITKKSETFVSSNFKILQNQDSKAEFVQTDAREFYTVSVSTSSNSIQGHFWNDKQLDSWNFSPKDENILSLAKRSYGNVDVAQNAIVLPDRSSLYKYLIPNVGVLTTHKEGEASDSIVFYLINLITGQVYGRLEKEVNKSINTNHDVHVTFEENFIVFTVPDKSSFIDTQICSIDLFEVLKPDKKLSGKSAVISAFDEPILPMFASQCFLLPGTSVRGLSISRTRHNIATKDIILLTNMGRVVAFPKMIVDGRRNGIIGGFKNFNSVESSVILLDDAKVSPFPQRISSSKYASSIASKFAYDPIISVNPQAVLTHHRKLVVNNLSGSTFLFTEPTELESTTYVVSIDGDIFVTFLRPSSSFDRLTSSFNSKVVIATIVVLLIGIASVRPKIQRNKILGRWAL
ncbi:hypothetical protein PMKS-000839 [Pichia membranifaciens]|uniref:ER membrane protein complex subunit 1 n=1 Tax=Pichia membranifaciens TaxID=4926 RepID=A0A1Q2YCV7_9ASCO|nr:hypothetical protein PMKS-000839 [Pichia membranifaciens]